MPARSPVVLAYDFSYSGHAALIRGVALAAAAPERIVLHVVCVVDPRHPIPRIATYHGVDPLYVARVQEALAFEVHSELELSPVTGCVHFFVHAPIGKPAAEILRLAAAVGADLIIIGSHGLTGLERLVIGSVSEKVVREAGCSVEVARPKRYADVDRAGAGLEHDATHAPPHRYEYVDHRVMLRPTEWPLP